MDNTSTYYAHLLYALQNFSEWITTATFCDFTAIVISLLTLYISYEYFMFYLRKRKTEKRFIRKDSKFIYNKKECPICYAIFTTPVVRAPCGHAYCLNCLLTYFTTNYSEWKCVCPLCRGIVTDFIILENMGVSNFNTKAQIAETIAQLSKLVKQQNKHIILSKPWPFIKAIALATPFILVLLLFKYITPEKLKNVDLSQAENIIQMGGQMIF